MADATSSSHAVPRRRSMLPQKASTKPTSTHLEALTEQQDSGPQGHPLASQKSGVSTATHASQIQKTRVPPPTSLGTSRSIRETGKTEPLRTSSLSNCKSTTGRPSRSSSQHSVTISALGRTSSAGENAHIIKKPPFHSRSVSQQVGPSPSQQRGKSSIPGASGLPSSTPSSRKSSMKIQRPGFSTMQQHFTPKKTIRSPAPSIASQPEKQHEIPSADVFHLQVKLTQLHLLHRSATTVQSQWEQSAKEFLQQRFSALCERHSELKEIAHQQQTLVNQLATVKWSQGKSGAQIAEKVQLLSRNIIEVCTLLDAGGKYARILEIFESWFSQALGIRGLRGSHDERAGNDLDLVEGIGDGWKAEAMVLERELTYCSRELKSFGDIDDGSSLGEVISLYSKLVFNLLGELDLIQWIENEVMSKEVSWIENTIGKLSSTVSNNIGSFNSNQAMS